MRVQQLFRNKYIYKKNIKQDDSLKLTYSLLMFVGYSSFHLFYILTADDINKSLKKIATKI